MAKLILITLAIATGVLLLSATVLSLSVQAGTSNFTTDTSQQVHVPGQRGIVVSALKGTAGLARNITVEAGQMVSSVASGITNFTKHSFRAIAAAISQSVNRIRGRHLLNDSGSQNGVQINVQPGEHVNVNLDQLNKVEAPVGDDELVNAAAASAVAA